MKNFEKRFFILLTGTISLGIMAGSIVWMIIKFRPEIIFCFLFGLVFFPTFLNSVKFWDKDGFEDYIADMGDML